MVRRDPAPPPERVALMHVDGAHGRRHRGGAGRRRERLTASAGGALRAAADVRAGCTCSRPLAERQPALYTATRAGLQMRAAGTRPVSRERLGATT